MNFYLMNELTGTVNGPYTLAQIQDMVKSGKIKKNSLFRKDNSEKWERAGVPLAKLFQQAELEKTQEKKRSMVARQDAKKSAAQEREIKVNRKVAAKRAKALQSSQQVVANREFNRGTLGEKIFGQLKPSPYWGFQVQGQIINVTIGLVILGAFFACLSLILWSGILLFMSDDAVRSRLWDLAISIFQSFVVLMGTFFVVALLVFYRNLIDWLIDMEGHANDLRKHFER